MEEKKVKRIGAYKVLSDSTLKSETKADLIERIRILEHNWAATEEALNNSAKNGAKLLAEQEAETERLTEDYEERLCAAANVYQVALDEKAEYERKLAEGELVSKDWHDEQVLHLQEEIERLDLENYELEKQKADLLIENAKQKEEIERLTEENEAIRINCENARNIAGQVLDKNEELQKLLDDKCDRCIERDRKDTAKEIFTALYHREEIGFDVIKWFAKEYYGVEVDE